MPQRILALDVTGTELRAAVLQTTFRDYRVEGFHRREISPDDTPAGVRQFIEEHLKPGDTVVSALPGDVVAWRTFFLPFRDQKRLARTVPFELENNVPFGLDEVVVDFQVLRRDRSGALVLAALVPKADLERHLTLLKESGVDPKVVDLGPVASLNTLGLIADRPPTFAFVDFRIRTTTVALYRDGTLVGLRTLSRAADPGTTDNGSGPGPQDPLAIGDIRWTLLALNGAPLDDGLPCFLGGAPALVTVAEERLKRELLLDTRRLDRERLRNLAPETSAEASEFGAALGLALREVSPAGTLGLNFRRGEFTFHRSQQEMRRALRGVAALAAAVVALTVGDLYMEYRQIATRAAAIDGQIRKVYEATVLDAAAGGDAVVQLQSEIDLMGERTKLVNDVVPLSSRTSVDILLAISAAVPNNIRIDVEDYNMDPDGVRLRANTDTFESVDAIKLRLLDTGVFSDVQVKDAKAGKDGTGVDFRMNLLLDKGLQPHVRPQ